MNLDVPVKRALQSLQREFGDLDEYVAGKLAMPVDELREVMEEKDNPLFAEQIDAIALAIDNMDNQGAFILGDMTGIGKGRALAALIRYAILSGKRPIFLTEKPNLFAAMLRDLEGIDSGGIVNPLIVNNGVSIRNELGEVVARSTPRPVLSEVMNSGDLGEFNCVFMTYSQINRPRDKDLSGKAEFLERIAPGSMLVLDESHAASGETSTTNENLMRPLELADSVVYSSATWAKRPNNMAVYFRTAIGSMVRSPRFPEIMKRGGEPLQEILSSMLAEQGQYIRREHDYSKAHFVTAVADHYSDQHRRIADQVSTIFAMIAALSGEVSSHIFQENEQMQQTLEELAQRVRGEELRIAQRMGVTGVNFSSRLWNLNYQFLLALKSQFTAEKAIEALERGEKPVLTISSTMESYVTELMRNELQARIEDGRLPEDATLADLEGEELNYGFREVVRRAVEAVLTVRRVDQRGVENVRRFIERTRADLEQMDPQDWTDSERLYMDIMENIDNLPDLPLSPIDKMMDEIRAAGYSIKEITGRRWGLDYSDPAHPRVYTRPPRDRRDRNSIISAFNNGVVNERGDRELLDAVVVNRAASAGIDLHSGRTFVDQRPRNMMLAQPELDVNNYMQLLGRIFRADMVGQPTYTSILADLPAEVRPAAMLNRKLSGLSANTNSNRESGAKSDFPDMFNWVGDQVALEVLCQNPDAADILQINLEQEMDRAEYARQAFVPTRLMERVTGRLTLLPVERQEEMYELFENRFHEQLAQFEAQGFNPFKTREFDVKAREVGRYLLEGDEQADNVFNTAVYVSEIEYEREVEPISWNEAMNTLEQMKARTQNRFGIAGETPLETLHMEIDRAIKARMEMIFRQQQRFSSIEEAISAKQDNAFRIMQRGRRGVDFLSKCLAYGAPFNIRTDTGRFVKSYFVGMDAPDPDRREVLGKYIVRFVSPDPEAKHLRFTLHGLCDMLDEHLMHPLPKDAPLEDAKAEFDAQKGGMIAERRLVLTGNLLKAVEYSQEHKMGMSAIYTTESGERVRGVVLPRVASKKALLGSVVTLENSRMLLDYAHDRDARILEAPLVGKQHLALVHQKGDKWTFVVPPSKRAGEAIYTNPRILELIGGKFGTQKQKLVAKIQGEENLSRLIDILKQEVGVTFRTNKHDKKAVEWAAEWRRKQREAEMDKTADVTDDLEPDQGLSAG